jgi:hypothetical protein
LKVNIKSAIKRKKTANLSKRRMQKPPV